MGKVKETILWYEKNNPPEVCNWFLGHRASASVHTTACSGELITPVGTVSLTITQPVPGHASMGALAAEHVRRTSDGTLNPKKSNIKPHVSNRTWPPFYLCCGNKQEDLVCNSSKVIIENHGLVCPSNCWHLI